MTTVFIGRGTYGPYGLSKPILGTGKSFLDEEVPSGFGFWPKPDSGRLWLTRANCGKVKVVSA